MTTIVAIALADRIVMAGDTRVTEPTTGRYYESDMVPKVAVRNDVIFGIAGDKKVMDHVILGWDVPTNLPEDPALAVHVALYPSLVEHIGDLGDDWNVLLGYGGVLFYLDREGAAHDGNHSSAAIGSGAWYALGYMQHVVSNTANLGELLGNAVRVAAEFDIHTSTDSVTVGLEHEPTE